MRTFLPVLILCVAINSGFAQAQPIEFQNPSFEDFARASSAPIHWYNCGFQGESPPDVQPDPTFGVSKKAYDGDTYLGMVVRDNNTWEAVSQKLAQPMQIAQCYQLEIYLARSDTYLSVSRLTDKAANYGTPAKLQVFGGFNNCDGGQFLAETPVVKHTDWKRYVLQFEPAIEAFDYLIFQVYYDESMPHPYNGNILADHLSALTLVDCGTLPKRKNEPAPLFIERKSPVYTPQVDKTDSLLTYEESKPAEEPAQQQIVKPAPISATELLQIVETSAPRIAFDASGLLETSLYNDLASGAEKQVNLPLQSIVDGLKQHSLATLIIVIVEKDVALAEKKKQSLKAALSQIGGRQDQIIVRNWLEKDAEKTWLGNPASGVLMRLIQ